jgi:hypothetical protein
MGPAHWGRAAHTAWPHMARYVPACLYCMCATHFSLIPLCVHALIGSSFCRPEPDRWHAGYQRLGWACEIMCVPVTHSHEKLMLASTGRLAGSYMTLQ